MKLPAAVMLSFALAATAACSTTSTPTVELPGGVLPEEQNREVAPPNFFDRLLGNDDRPNVGPCPLMGVLYDSARIVDFAQAGQQRYANIQYTGEMNGVRGLCRYVDADPITMALEVDMSFGRGPAATAERHTYRYWVAVARRGRAPIEKVYFDVDVEWERGEVVANHREQIERIVIPRANPEISGENFEILVGFELTPEQLQFNRDGRRFRIDAADNAGG
ncbi:MAG: Tat pathway signal sequence domain protein [Hyphomonadaceae bacterium JAD_PAG50586_4]|nr:MAG: Tat pathway signal sequence domain protein [Hyphomonadaceae bacterium JAD_PAG50586_4]